MHICKLIHHHSHICKQKTSDSQSITVNKQMHEHKTNTWKQHLDEIGHRHHPHSLWGTIAKLSNKKIPTEQNRSIHFGTKTTITDIDKAKHFMNITPAKTK